MTAAPTDGPIMKEPTGNGERRQMLTGTDG